MNQIMISKLAAHPQAPTHPYVLGEALGLIQAERLRQEVQEGYLSAQDDAYTQGELMSAGRAYLHAHLFNDPTAIPEDWPWDASHFKPRDVKSNLVRAGALFLAEMQRRMRSGDFAGGRINEYFARAAQDLAEALVREHGWTSLERFWLIMRDPGRVPVRKGPWLEGPGRKAAILREFMEANPAAYIDVLTLGNDGPDIEHGPQLLQMLDGRSMAKARKQIEQAREAHAPHHAALAADADALVVLAAAREYVADALEAHDHTDGRELLSKIDGALKVGAAHG